MFKYIFILLNVVLLVGARGLSGDSNIKVTQYVPNAALTGSEFIEEIVISKPASVNSFAKFEQQLPNGMVAVGLDIKGGTLTQDENNLVKIIWYKISDLNEFTIKLRILVDHETSLNEYALSSRFAYLEFNDRNTVSSNTSQITIEKGLDKPVDENEKELAKLSDTTLHRAMTENIDKMLREAGVACTQVSEMLSKTEAKIEIKVIKGKISGFAKIEEPICEGATAINIESGGAVFSFNNGKVKYVWTDLPAGQNVTVSFKLVRKKGAGWLNRCTLEGDFAYLEDEKSLRCNFNSITVDFEKGVTVPNLPLPADALAKKEVNVSNADSIIQNKSVAISNESQKSAPQIEITTQKNSEAMREKNLEADTRTVMSTEVKNTDKKEITINKEVEKATTIEQKQETKKEVVAVSNNNSNAAISGLVFKVQVCATHRTVDANYIKTNYKLPEEVMQEMHEGWFKYTVGGYAKYTEARNKREDLVAYNLPGPFVTAYNNGNRITVQEALMIDKQQWVK